jgi:hypothetical protein
MAFADVLPQAIELPEDDRSKLLFELADSMGMEIIDLEVEQRREEMNTDPSCVLNSSQLKTELQKLRNVR